MSAQIRKALFARMRRDTPAQCERCNAPVNPRYLDTHICLSLRPQLPAWTLDQDNRLRKT